MTPESFFELFVQELKQAADLRPYYKLLDSPSYFEFRKSYLLSRWRYIHNCLIAGKTKNATIWDFGCGYGTTALFLAMNNFNVCGSTIDVPPHIIPRRKRYWGQFGDVGLFTETYLNLFTSEVPCEQYDFIIAQDTLHHLEPIGKGLAILRDALKPRGRLIVLEENGQNVLQTFKLYLRRGNKRITTIRDQASGDMVLIGNENIRGFNAWRTLLEANGLAIIDNRPQYIRFFLPCFSDKLKAEEIFKREKRIAQNHRFLRERFFFGINFEAYRSVC